MKIPSLKEENVAELREKFHGFCKTRNE